MIEWYIGGIATTIVFGFVSAIVQSWLEQREEKKLKQQRIEEVLSVITRDEDLFFEFLKKESNRQWLRSVLKENE
jgi:hypothetical protein